MTHYIYIIYSKSIDKYYIGETNNIENRLKQHLEHHFSSSFTKAASDWRIAYSKNCNSKNDAVYLEKFIKRMKSKKFIRKIIENPKILDDILLKR